MAKRAEQPKQDPETPSLRELTERTLPAAHPADGFPDRLVLALLDDAKDLLSAVGVRLSMVSVDEERAVFVSEPTNGVTVQTACELSRRTLTQVAESVPGPTTELVELRCGRHSEWPCTFSLEWGQGQGQGQAASAQTSEVPSLEMLIGGEEHAPARRPAAARMAAVALAAPAVAAEPSPVHSPTADSAATRGEDTVPPRPTRPDDTPRRRRRPHLLPPWLKRRWWLLALCVVAGTAGGYFARASQTPMYSASSEIVVATGAGQKGPGDANDAIALALTDASILPSDQALLNSVSRKIGVPTREIAAHLSASVEAGTSVILVSYDASNPTAAIKGANAVGRTITSQDEQISAIPNGSLSLVQLATGASASGMLFTYGLPLGALLGLLIGLVFVVGIERADPRADDVEDLAQATGTAATAYPGPVSLAELEQLLDRASDGAPAATLVPLSDAEVSHLIALRNGLDAAVDHQSLAIEMAGPVGSLDDRLTRGEGPTVLVVKPGARLRGIKESVHRLEMLGRRPVWAVLAVGAPPGTRR
jgi:capsular polysaccharide biosynthesis protein